ncbi:MMPL family transporter [Mumia sp. zg.B17]|uniref:MMPL family transporter n=1 Tax=Mumia sp. zg.B17 TaxID=2855446 RepID=UPI001C6F16A1|nr:MMPL family transporter [Mumia sp. zg.B17]MBW9205439.1 MMPL family transporter [Mumia sp. zg.B17]
MERWGRFVARRAGWVVGLGLLVLAAAGAYGTGVFAALSDGGFDDPGSESYRASELIDDSVGRHGADVVAVYESDEMTVDAAPFRAAVTEVVEGLSDEAVEQVMVYGAPGTDALVSADRHATSVVITLAGDDEDAVLEAYDEVRPALDGAAVENGTLDLAVAGKSAVFDDVSTTVSQDIARAEMLAMPLVLLLSLVVFGSVVAALMPVGVGAVAVLGAFAVVRLLTTVTDVSVFALNIITLLGLGLAIDYALFVVSRFREELAVRDAGDRGQVQDAVGATMRTAGRTVLFSGLTVAVAMSALLAFPQTFLRSMAYGGMAAVVVAMVAALTLLPATLALLGRRIEAGAMPWRRRARRTSQGWARFAHAVMRRPVVSLALVTGFLLLLASPFLSATWGGVDYRALPSDAPSRIATEKLDTDFGGPSSSADVFFASTERTEVASYAADLRAVDGVTQVRPVAEGGGGTLIDVDWTGTSQSAASQELVRSLRAVDAPADAYVGGRSAETVDMLDGIADRLPLMGSLIVVAMLVLLFLAFGSVVLPVKAVLVNIVSITAAFGVVTWVFADGNLEGLLGYSSTGYLDGTQPILMAAILFGLSMDYEIFLLSRIREEWDATGDNEVAVARGVQKTGRIITSAALLLAVVTGAFATSGIVFIKMVGVGMLVALIVDATLVRLLMVPATMKLLGRANWWAPGPLRRWWERHGLREGGTVPVAGGATDDRVGRARILAE